MRFPHQIHILDKFRMTVLQRDVRSIGLNSSPDQMERKQQYERYLKKSPEMVVSERTDIKNKKEHSYLGIVFFDAGDHTITHFSAYIYFLGNTTE